MTAGVKAGEILQKIRDTKLEYNGLSHSVTMTFGVAEGDSDRPISEQRLDDENLIDKLRTASRFFTAVSGGLGVVFMLRVLPYA